MQRNYDWTASVQLLYISIMYNSIAEQCIINILHPAVSFLVHIPQKRHVFKETTDCM